MSLFLKIKLKKLIFRLLTKQLNLRLNYIEFFKSVYWHLILFILNFLKDITD